MKLGGILVFLLFIMSGCATTPQYTVTVDSITGAQAHAKTKYLLLPGVATVDANDLEFRQFANVTEQNLTSLGYIKATDYNDANVAIFLGYGIGDPDAYESNYSIPIPQKKGFSFTTKPSANSTQSDAEEEEVDETTVELDASNSDIKYLFLDAIDLTEFKKSKRYFQVWKTSSVSAELTGELREVFPQLVAAAKPYIAKNTGKKINVLLSANDNNIIDIIEYAEDANEEVEGEIEEDIE